MASKVERRHCSHSSRWFTCQQQHTAPAAQQQQQQQEQREHLDNSCYNDMRADEDVLADLLAEKWQHG
jgi:hypothetical protein